MRLFFIAGEASGDLHGGNLIKELKSADPDLEIYGWGGDKMQEAGMTTYKHFRELAFMGFWEVAKNIRTIQQNFTLCKEQIRSCDPDAVIFIDYPGFNLRMVKWVKKLGIKTVYYISPQVWAWKSGRVKKIKQFVDHMITILPFEKSWYQKRDYQVAYVGHPLLDAIDQFKVDEAFLSSNEIEEKPIIALLPGSRAQEIRKHLPIFLEATKSYKEYQPVVAAAPGADPIIYQDIIKGQKVKVVYDQTYEILHAASIALVSSGTATLETALFQVPQIVGYKGSSLSYWIAKQVIKVKYISLVNLIFDRQVVPELIQKDLNPTNIKRNLDILLTDEGKQNQIVAYKTLRGMLDEGGASKMSATLIMKVLQNQ